MLTIVIKPNLVHSNKKRLLLLREQKNEENKERKEKSNELRMYNFAKIISTNFSLLWFRERCLSKIKRKNILHIVKT